MPEKNISEFRQQELDNALKALMDIETEIKEKKDAQKEWGLEMGAETLRKLQIQKEQLKKEIESLKKKIINDKKENQDASIIPKKQHITSESKAWRDILSRIENAKKKQNKTISEIFQKFQQPKSL